MAAEVELDTPLSPPSFLVVFSEEPVDLPPDEDLVFVDWSLGDEELDDALDDSLPSSGSRPVAFLDPNTVSSSVMIMSSWSKLFELLNT